MGAWYGVLVCCAMAGGHGDRVAGEQVKKAAPNPPLNVQPVVPIPTGQAGASNYTHFAWSGAGVSVGHGHRDEYGVWAEHAVGRTAGMRTFTLLKTTDHSQTTSISRWTTKGDRTAGGGLAHKVYLADRWDVRCEIEATNSGPRVGGRITFWAFEGIAFGLGLDSSTGVVLHYDRYYDEDDLHRPGLAWYILAAGLIQSLHDHLSARQQFLAEFVRLVAEGRE